MLHITSMTVEHGVVTESLVANPTGAAFKGKEQPSGYTERLLHAWRLKKKAQV